MNGLPYYKAYPRDFIEGTVVTCPPRDPSV